MEHCRSPDGVTSISVRPYYTMLSRIYLALDMGFLVHPMTDRILSCDDEDNVVVTGVIVFFQTFKVFLSSRKTRFNVFNSPSIVLTVLSFRLERLEHP